MFLALMITGGYTPVFLGLRIVKLEFQTGDREDPLLACHTDDLRITTKNESGQTRRILCQIKRSLVFSNSDPNIQNVLTAAWNDYNNPSIFTFGTDAIAFITGPLSGVDQSTIPWILDQAHIANCSDDFFQQVRGRTHVSNDKRKRLETIIKMLNIANNGREIEDIQIYRFLKHIYLLGYDLDIKHSVSKSLIHSHLSLSHKQNPISDWAILLETVSRYNSSGGTISVDNLPDEISALTKRQHTIRFEDVYLRELPTLAPIQDTPEPSLLVRAALVGSWTESTSDNDIVKRVLGDNYENGLRELLAAPQTPLTCESSLWHVEHRLQIVKEHGARIIKTDVDALRTSAIELLKTTDPALSLPPEDRWLAAVYNKTPSHSYPLKKGIVEGLAILNNNPKLLLNADQNTVKQAGPAVIRALFENNSWQTWATLNSHLPTLAEAAPDAFLKVIEHSLKNDPNLFHEIFSQETKGGHNNTSYLTGTLWALETLAWDPIYLLRTSLILAELASIDPGGNLGNRPINSLVTIFLAWIPRTIASTEAQITAVKAILREQPQIGWDLLFRLLPKHNGISSGTRRPEWRKTIPDDWQDGVTPNEYESKVSAYVKLVFESIGADTDRLTQFIAELDSLLSPHLDQFIVLLNSIALDQLTQDQLKQVWNSLTALLAKHSQYTNARWALPKSELEKIEKASIRFKPSSSFHRNQYLFNYEVVDLYEGDDWKLETPKIEAKREDAAAEVLNELGTSALADFARAVRFPHYVGAAIANTASPEQDKFYIAYLFNEKEANLRYFAKGYIRSKFNTLGWEWAEPFIDQMPWSSAQVSQFLLSLPFQLSTWERAEKLLGSEESLYWKSAPCAVYQGGEHLQKLLTKLLTFNRPYCAIRTLYVMIEDKLKISSSDVLGALNKAAVSTEEPDSSTRSYALKLISYLQSDETVSAEQVENIEWTYLSLLTSSPNPLRSPVFLMRKLTNDAEFFCEIIRTVYKADESVVDNKKTSETDRVSAKIGSILLDKWSTLPGFSEDGVFSGQVFNKWLSKVREECEKSKHLDTAFDFIGKACFHAPADPTGLWIHQDVVSALNARDAEAMRTAYYAEAINTIGAYFVAPDGSVEASRAASYLEKSQAIENAGFSRFATTLRHLSEYFSDRSDRVVIEHSIGKKLNRD